MPLENTTAPSPAQGLVLCPVQPVAAGQVFTLCAALAPQGGGFRLVTLRQSVDARVYLGALTDGSGAVREWLELWVQSVGGLAGSPASHRAPLSNEALDEQWRRRAATFRSVDPEGMIETGWDVTPPGPILLDAAKRAAVAPADPAGGAPLATCRDEALLAKSGLPAYATSLHRYWQTTGADAAVRFAVTSGAPVTDGVASWTTGPDAWKALLAFNAEGGRMLVRRFSPLAYEEFADLVGGKPWKGVVESRDPAALEPAYAGLGDWDRMQQTGDYLLVASRGRAAQISEAFHLKLRLFSDAVESIRARVKATQLPFLNLSDRSFRVELTGAGSPGGLPVLWTARVRPALPGQALALAVKTTDVRYFLALESPASSVYRPKTFGIPVKGVGQVRLRKIVKGTGAETVLEGTLVTNEKLDAAANDLVWIQFPLRSGRYDLFGRIDYAEGLAKGEARFRSIPQDIPAETVAELRAVEGVPYADTAFETIPLLSTPCDLYALGILGIRTFLCNAGTSMGVAVDEMLSLARELGLEHDPKVPLGLRVRATVEKDPRLMASLGPHRLLHAEVKPQEALAALPSALWWDLIGTLARLLPGYGPDSYCRDFSDVPTYGIEAVFERPAADLRQLLLRSRSLLLIDWSQNREIAQQVSKAFEANLL
jgi:hypothetical protein